MSRPKSAATIQLERDRAIRKERREQKRTEREVRRKERLRKRATHESVIRHNGIIPVKADERYLGLRDAIAYSPLTWCEACKCIVRESAMKGDVCEACWFTSEGKEVVLDDMKTEAETELRGDPCGRPEAKR